MLKIKSYKYDSMNKNCERCKKEFTCNTNDIKNCDCTKIVLKDETKKFLSNTFYNCLCNDCLNNLNDFSLVAEKYKFPELTNEYIVDVHYYIENEFWVFTEFFHFQKGNCCKNNCRHCAYGYTK